MRPRWWEHFDLFKADSIMYLQISLSQLHILCQVATIVCQGLLGKYIFYHLFACRTCDSSVFSRAVRQDSTSVATEHGLSHTDSTCMKTSALHTDRLLELSLCPALYRFHNILPTFSSLYFRVTSTAMNWDVPFWVIGRKRAGLYCTHSHAKLHCQIEKPV